MSDRLALVARAGGPLGRAVCKRLARNGHDVVVHFEQDDETAQAAARAVEEQGREATLAAGRVGDAMVADSLAARTRREHGTPHAMVVCPRGAPIAQGPRETEGAREAFCSIDLGSVEPVLQADLKGPMALVQRFGAGMAEAGRGAIALVGTGAALRAGPTGAPARAAHEGLVSIVRSAARALGPEVRVNAVTPGAILPGSENVQNVGTEGVALDGIEDEVGKAGGAVGGMVSVDALADAVVHLLEAPERVTGQVLDLDERGPLEASERVTGQVLDLDERGPLEASERGAGRDAGADDVDLPGIEQRVEPPDPHERIDLDDG